MNQFAPCPHLIDTSVGIGEKKIKQSTPMTENQAGEINSVQ
jgi:hypothetical protein